MADWTPDRIIALPDDGCGAPATGQCWVEEEAADERDRSDGAAYLLATPERVAAGELVEALDRMTSAYLEIAELRGEGDLSWMPCARQARAALAKAGKETDDGN